MAYTEHNTRPDNSGSDDCQVCGTTHTKLSSTPKHCFCNTCLVVTPHTSLDAPRPFCSVCDTRYSAQPPADEHGQRLRQAAELELRELKLRHPVRHGSIYQRGGFVAVLSAGGASSDVATSTGV
jgi:hypothetical protein